MRSVNVRPRQSRRLRQAAERCGTVATASGRPEMYDEVVGGSGGGGAGWPQGYGPAVPEMGSGDPAGCVDRYAPSTAPCEHARAAACQGGGVPGRRRARAAACQGGGVPGRRRAGAAACRCGGGVPVRRRRAVAAAACRCGGGVPVRRRAGTAVCRYGGGVPVRRRAGTAAACRYGGSVPVRRQRAGAATACRCGGSVPVRRRAGAAACRCGARRHESAIRWRFYRMGSRRCRAAVRDCQHPNADRGGCDTAPLTGDSRCSDPSFIDQSFSFVKVALTPSRLRLPVLIFV